MYPEVIIHNSVSLDHAVTGFEGPNGIVPPVGGLDHAVNGV
ncbi:hypothetical protein [Methanoculleus sp.]|jgi:hypothetical protein|nr:hypothetical protein [Methanoculleus sp.]